jgi:acyl-coenzyme A thioesterase PaaI-like protein
VTEHIDPLLHVAQPDHPDATANARAAAGTALRELGHALVGHHAPLDMLDRVAGSLEALRAEMADGPTRSRAEVRSPSEWVETPADGAVLTSYDDRPVSGRSSPWGLDVEVRREGDEAVGVVTLREAHEGAPGRSHGGIVAALFDDVFGFVLTIIGQPAFTGELSIRYVAGVPIGVPLQCRVRLVERDGRKMYMTGELTDAARVVATAQATFIAVEQLAVPT